MTWTLTASGTAVAKAGTNANTDIIVSGTTLLKWCTQAEGWLETATGINFRDNYSSLPTSIQDIADDIVSSKIALNIAGYDTSGYLVNEVNTILNLNDGIVERGVNLINDMKNKTFEATPWS